MAGVELLVNIEQKNIDSLMRAYFQGVTNIDVATACAIDSIIESLVDNVQNSGLFDRSTSREGPTKTIKLCKPADRPKFS